MTYIFSTNYGSTLDATHKTDKIATEHDIITTLSTPFDLSGSHLLIFLQMLSLLLKFRFFEIMVRLVVGVGNLVRICVDVLALLKFWVIFCSRCREQPCFEFFFVN